MKRTPTFGAALPATPEEHRAHAIIRDMLSSAVDDARIQSRKMKSYFLVMLDGNHTRPICRLYLDRHMAIGWITERKVEVREPIRRVEDICRFNVELATVVQKYLNR